MLYVYVEFFVLKVLKFTIDMFFLASRVYNSFQRFCQVGTMESQDQFAPNCALLLSTNETDCSTSTLLVEFSFNLLVLLVIII